MDGSGGLRDFQQLHQSSFVSIDECTRIEIGRFAVEDMFSEPARQKDSGWRCDLEAGMAKLIAARIAWTAADNAVQIHGGNGFALEYPVSRVLCDARILNISEGAAEIQAQVIARRLLNGSN